jgi:hypothetical protein
MCVRGDESLFVIKVYELLHIEGQLTLAILLCMFLMSSGWWRIVYYLKLRNCWAYPYIETTDACCSCMFIVLTVLVAITNRNGMAAINGWRIFSSVYCIHRWKSSSREQHLLQYHVYIITRMDVGSFRTSQAYSMHIKRNRDFMVFATALICI